MFLFLLSLDADLGCLARSGYLDTEAVFWKVIKYVRSSHPILTPCFKDWIQCFLSTSPNDTFRLELQRHQLYRQNMIRLQIILWN